MRVLVVLLIFHAMRSHALPKTIRITKLEHCDLVADYPLKMFFKFRTISNVQYFDFTAKYSIPFADNATIDFHVAVSKNGKNFVHFMSLHEEDVCRFHKKYLGPFYAEVHAKFGLSKEQCPIPKGNYEVKNMKLDFSTIPMYAFPTGKLRARQVIESKATRRVLSCVAIEVTSQ